MARLKQQKSVRYLDIGAPGFSGYIYVDENYSLALSLLAWKRKVFFAAIRSDEIVLSVRSRFLFSFLLLLSTAFSPSTLLGGGGAAPPPAALCPFPPLAR